jgi:hypothetical protein
MRLLKIALALSVILYVVDVSLLSLTRKAGFNEGLSTSEIFFGPAVTIAFGLILAGIVYALSGSRRRQNQGESTESGYR